MLLPYAIETGPAKKPYRQIGAPPVQTVACPPQRHVASVMGTDSYFRSIQLGSVALRVADLGRALAFYEGVLGFDVDATGAHSTTLAAGPNGSALLELEASPAAPARRHGEAGLFHVALLFPTRASLGRMLSHLASADVRLGAADHGVSEALYLADPEGNGLELYVDRPAAAWPAPAADGQVTMFTEALDLTALAAAGAEAQGPMLPGDVRIGHIHLAVSSLGHAEEFYGRRLGFAVRQRSYPGALFMARDGYHHHIGATRGVAVQEPRPARWDWFASASALRTARSSSGWWRRRVTA
jgi:catechol 2,3-dioxygenase